MLLQLIPASVVLNSTSPAKYSVFGSWGENTIGSVHQSEKSVRLPSPGVSEITTAAPTT